jgi:hypothetical protein
VNGWAVAGVVIGAVVLYVVAAVGIWYAVVHRGGRR